MKHSFLILAVLSLLASKTDAQVRAVLWSGESLQIDSLMEKIETYGDNIYIRTADGSTLSFTIQELKSLEWASDPTQVSDIPADSTAIIYNSETGTVSVSGCNANEGKLLIFDAEGKLLKSAKGITISVSELPKGIYIVNWNGILSVKFSKK